MLGLQCSQWCTILTLLNCLVQLLFFTGDCLPSIPGLLKMGGTPGAFPEIKRLYLFAAHVDFIWGPRESPEMLITDELTREEDSSQIFVTRKTFHRIVSNRQGVVHWACPLLMFLLGLQLGGIKLHGFTLNTVVLFL